MRKELIDKVTSDLEARGGKCIVHVSTRLIPPDPDGEIDWDLDYIDVRFPSGRRWNIVNILEEPVWNILGVRVAIAVAIAVAIGVAIALLFYASYLIWR